MINRFSRRLAWIVLPLLFTAVAHAQQTDFPNKQIRIMVGFPPGGGVDVIARVIGAELGKMWRQSVIVENRAGASGMIAANMITQAPADGYEVQIATPNSDTLGPQLIKPPYDVLRDFTPITLAVQVPNVLVVNNALPVHTMKELVALAKAKPGTLTFASSGVGSVQQLAGESFNAMTGAKAVHVPYKGSSAAMVDLVAGQVSMSFETSGGALTFIRSGKLRALAMLSAQRNPALPDVPTSAEAGFPGFEFSTWYGFTGPRGMPPAVVQKWQQSIAKVMQLPNVRAQIQNMGGEAVASTPEQFKVFRQNEYALMGKLIKQTGITAQ
jgi:tripartite-type tricarboxylate transporter receptor subunit TctC